ncbi:MAG TPA: glycosyltransferase, partial [Geobacteraceae bacterium]|nr:glycosyltransferase [Geobacteraceae bacterium]
MINSNSILFRYLDYPKLKEPPFRVVLLDSGYLTVRECRKGLEKLGHRVFTIVPGPDFIKRLLTLLVEVRPDFLLAINHLGFDEEGKLTGLLTELKVPFASWYVDSPTYILYGGEENISPYCAVFCWERAYLQPVAEMGFHSPTFLPLATDPEVFSPGGNPVNGRFASSLAFVGDSMETAQTKWEKKLSNKVKKDIASISAEKMQIDRKKEILEIFPSLEGHAVCKRSRLDIEAALIWKATQEYRLRLARSLIPLGLVIYGDAGWSRFFARKRILRPKVDYFRELPDVYRGTDVNINCTSFQMKTAVNQRVFDVAACGGFLLSDYQEDMDRFFEVGKEAICFRTTEEAVSLAAYYLVKDTERRKIAEAAR